MINLSKTETIVVHSIGIGSDCDRYMLEKMAERGRGTCSIIRDNEDERVLNSKVITALDKALEPALELCNIIWNTQNIQLNTIFRN